MLYSIKDREDLGKLNELVFLENQVKFVGLQDKLGKQNFHEDMEKLFESVTKSFKDVSEEVRKTMTENSSKNNKAIEILYNKLLEIMNDRGIIGTYLMSLLSKISNSENSRQFKLVKVSISNTVIHLKLNKTIPNTLYNNLLTFCDTGKEFELTGDLSKKITNKNYKSDLASLQDKKFLYGFAKEMKFDLKAQGNKSTRDHTLIKLLKSPGLIVSASGVSKTIFLSSDTDELSNRLNLLLEQKHAGNDSNIINDEIVAIVDKLLEYKYISKKQHKQLLIKCNLLNK